MPPPRERLSGSPAWVPGLSGGRCWEGTVAQGMLGHVICTTILESVIALVRVQPAGRCHTGYPVVVLRGHVGVRSNLLARVVTQGLLVSGSAALVARFDKSSESPLCKKDPVPVHATPPGGKDDSLR